jgi:hypothetical protein
MFLRRVDRPRCFNEAESGLSFLAPGRVVFCCLFSTAETVASWIGSSSIRVTARFKAALKRGRHVRERRNLDLYLKPKPTPTSHAQNRSILGSQGGMPNKRIGVSLVIPR